MPDWLWGVLPGVLSGVASGLVTLGALRASVCNLLERTKNLEAQYLDILKGLSRIEGRLWNEPKKGRET
jgi:hypothetical protein